METSMQSGLQDLYQKVLNQYPDPQDQATKQHACALFMRLVFCMYADDLGLLTLSPSAASTFYAKRRVKGQRKSRALA